MSEKEFGIKFTKTDTGFRFEVSGDEEMVQAHREMTEAWKEFVSKARQAGDTHRKHFHHHDCCCCCDDEEKEGNDKE